MRLTRIYLQNYRVYEAPLDLEIPPGLVGIYGLNGAGKSSLIEAIRWVLYGRSRTPIDEIRTSGINADCVTEVEFEHEGHLYTVRRVISGAGSHVRAGAMADGFGVSEGVRDTARYVHSILGMDEAAFRASVFAEQKQLASFSTQSPADRRRLVLSLLGITPLDAARDAARRDAREQAVHLDRLRQVLEPLANLESALAQAQVDATSADIRAGASEAAAAAAAKAAEDLSRRVGEWEELARRHERLTAEMRSTAAGRARAADAVARLASEVAELEKLAARREDLRVQAEGWQLAEARLRRVEAVAAAQAALDRLPADPRADPPDDLGMERTRRQAEEARAALAAVNGRFEAATAERLRATEAARRSATLTGEGDCPMCGQELGSSFAAVQAHRAAEVAAVERRLLDLELDRNRAVSVASATAERALAATKAHKQAQAAWAEAGKILARRQAAETALTLAAETLGRRLEPGERASLAAEVERRRRAADEYSHLGGRMERLAAATAELDVERAALAEASATGDRLRRAAEELGPAPPDLAGSRQSLLAASAAAKRATAAAGEARAAAAGAGARTEAAAARLADARGQHAQVDRLAEEARHLARVAELLNGFRNTLVATVGPRLSAQAADLFSELTDAEYDRLEVDPDTYEIKIFDGGSAYRMDRFSGSETDLANLALRVAVSEQIHLQSGGAVGLLVLDEVFGPLDDDRKERMLMALNRLRGRFRQILVVTHDSTIKEQLPHAIEVVKLPGRRATARLISA
ncbi:MAG: AAA family ATPase [Acidimicrobiales bacterium]